MNIMQIYVNSLIGVIVIWGVLIAPFKSEVKRIVGKDDYKLIISEYRKMRRDRTFGAIGVVLGLLGILSVYGTMALERNLPTVMGEKALKIFPFAFVAGGFYCYLMGFVKAIAMIIKSKSSSPEVKEELK